MSLTIALCDSRRVNVRVGCTFAIGLSFLSSSLLIEFARSVFHSIEAPCAARFRVILQLVSNFNDGTLSFDFLYFVSTIKALPK